MEERSGIGRDEGEKGGDEGDISAAASVRSRCQKGVRSLWRTLPSLVVRCALAVRVVPCAGGLRCDYQSRRLYMLDSMFSHY